MASQGRIKTQHFESILSHDQALALYLYLETTVDWEDSIPSRTQGQTRKGRAVTLFETPELSYVLDTILNKLSCTKAHVYGVYLNYYRDGNDFCPNHTHKDTRQVILSLGATRTLRVGAKNYRVKNGDAVVFGGSLHGVPKEPEVTEGRISVAFFLSK